MKLAFNIQSENINPLHADLYVEIDEQGLSYIIIENGNCVALVVYHFGIGCSDDLVSQYIHQVVTEQSVLQQKFKKAYIIYGYAPSVLVPNEFMPESNIGALLELVYGDSSERITKSDYMYRQSVHNIYGVPASVDLALTRHFGTAIVSHLFSLWPGVMSNGGNQLYCIFNTSQLKVLLLKDDKIQVMQSYYYKTPEDVAYHLLNLCNSFDIGPDDVLVQLTGMIDVNSALYSGLYKYFLQLEFGILPNQYHYPDAVKEYPEHYFSHLFAIAACV